MEKINKTELNKLFIEMKNGITTAFEKLYDTSHKLVYCIAFSIVKNKQDAEDVVQIVFTKIYSIEKSKLPSKNAASWLYSITRNEAINFLKKRKNSISLDDIYEIADHHSEIDNIVDTDYYNKLISGLNDKEKEIVSLKILANLSFDEIGKMLNIPTGTVKWRYYKSIHTLKILLNNLGLFIITAILSMVTLKANPIESENNPIKNEPIGEEDVSVIPPKEELKKDEESILENTNSQTQETITEIPNMNHNINYVGFSFMGISTISFISTIIFFIIFTKHQLKRRKKLSK